MPTFATLVNQFLPPATLAEATAAATAAEQAAAAALAKQYNLNTASSQLSIAIANAVQQAGAAAAAPLLTNNPQVPASAVAGYACSFALNTMSQAVPRIESNSVSAIADLTSGPSAWVSFRNTVESVAPIILAVALPGIGSAISEALDVAGILGVSESTAVAVSTGLAHVAVSVASGTPITTAIENAVIGAGISGAATEVAQGIANAGANVTLVDTATKIASSTVTAVAQGQSVTQAITGSLESLAGSAVAGATGITAAINNVESNVKSAVADAFSSTPSPTAIQAATAANALTSTPPDSANAAPAAAAAPVPDTTAATPAPVPDTTAAAPVPDTTAAAPAPVPDTTAAAPAPVPDTTAAALVPDTTAAAPTSTPDLSQLTDAQIAQYQASLQIPGETPAQAYAAAIAPVPDTPAAAPAPVLDTTAAAAVPDTTEAAPVPDTPAVAPVPDTTAPAPTSAPDLSQLTDAQIAQYQAALQNPGETPAQAYAAAIALDTTAAVPAFVPDTPAAASVPDTTAEAPVPDTTATEPTSAPDLSQLTDAQIAQYQAELQNPGETPMQAYAAVTSPSYMSSINSAPADNTVTVTGNLSDNITAPVTDTTITPPYVPSTNTTVTPPYVPSTDNTPPDSTVTVTGNLPTNVTAPIEDTTVTPPYVPSTDNTPPDSTVAVTGNLPTNVTAPIEDTTVTPPYVPSSPGSSADVSVPIVGVKPVTDTLPITDTTITPSVDKTSTATKTPVKPVTVGNLIGSGGTTVATNTTTKKSTANAPENAKAVIIKESRAGAPTMSAQTAAPEIYNSIDPSGTRYTNAPIASNYNGPSDLQLAQSIANGTPVAAVGQEAINANLAGYKNGGLAHFADGGATTDSTNGAPPAISPLQDIFSNMQKNLKDSQPVFAAHPQSMLSISRPPATFGAQSSASPNMPLLNLEQARHFQFHAQGGGIHTDPKIEGVSGLGSLHEGGNAAYHYQGAPDDHKPEFITGATGYHVQGKGTGQSDDIPAMLADGEYVFDADTVSALGDGSNKAGAEVLNKMREALRAHKRSAPNDKIPPPAKTPLEYMKKALKG